MADPGDALVPRGLLRLGVATWTVVGLAIVFSIILGLLAAVSELVMPLIFAVMLAIVVYPAVRRLLQRGLRPSIAALSVVTGVIIVGVGVVLIAVRALVGQAGELSDSIDQAITDLSASGDTTGLDAATLERIRSAIASVGGFIVDGLLTLLVGGVNAVIGLITGVILAMLIMYYVLKDGPDIRTWMVHQFPEHLRAEAASFLSTAVRSVRGYWAGRSVLSAVVTTVVVTASLMMGLPLISTIAIVNFFGGFVPYIGAFIGGGLATLLAYVEGGIAPALVMLAIVLVSNLLLENLLEPRIMSGRLKMHPLVVLIATTAGGVVGGIVGLVLAVPVTAVTIDLVQRLRRLGAVSAARARVEPTLRKAISESGV